MCRSTADSHYFLCPKHHLLQVNRIGMRVTQMWHVSHILTDCAESHHVNIHYFQ